MKVRTWIAESVETDVPLISEVDLGKSNTLGRTPRPYYVTFNTVKHGPLAEICASRDELGNLVQALQQLLDRTEEPMPEAQPIFKQLV